MFCVQKNRISLVHNGTILNYAELKKELENNGVTFRSDTDTEVIANLISWVRIIVKITTHLHFSHMYTFFFRVS